MGCRDAEKVDKPVVAECSDYEWLVGTITEAQMFRRARRTTCSRCAAWGSRQRQHQEPNFFWTSMCHAGADTGGFGWPRFPAHGAWLHDRTRAAKTCARAAAIKARSCPLGISGGRALAEIGEMRLYF